MATPKCSSATSPTLESPSGLTTAALDGGPVDVLVANAGPFAEHRFVDATDEDWTSAFAGNVVSAVGCARGVIPTMRRTGWGQIITIGSRGAVIPLPNMDHREHRQPRCPPHPEAARDVRVTRTGRR